ncbi:hypothetical protein BDB00DRAFT_790979 [Zychaea mexicana]|uniref:uncharacterized protein n=1 Tax=Zychaea mexicana TaxID=64656 RepID=UPI0022FDEFEE|nr:uncharacterized protein BDB00DRAFT_790979 [Zychaea mexicana]KAI9489557.1 hypothetical protein BDB00DRAFT_790979 [Zychaea mexicana]
MDQGKWLCDMMEYDLMVGTLYTVAQESSQSSSKGLATVENVARKQSDRKCISNEIPQFVVIRDQVHSTYKHPIVHYVFEDEPFPEVPKDNLIMVDLDENAQLGKVESYSPHFQVTNCRLDHNSTVYDQFEGDHDGSGLMTIEGVSAPRA